MANTCIVYTFYMCPVSTVIALYLFAVLPKSVTKGHLILECPFDVLNFPKNQPKKLTKIVKGHNLDTGFLATSQISY